MNEFLCLQYINARKVCLDKLKGKANDYSLVKEEQAKQFIILNCNRKDYYECIEQNSPMYLKLYYDNTTNWEVNKKKKQVNYEFYNNC